MKTEVYYRVKGTHSVHPSFNSLEEAQDYIKDLGESVDEEYKEYWARQRRKAYIEEVVETSGVVQKPTISPFLRNKEVISIKDDLVSGELKNLHLDMTDGKHTLLVYKGESVGDENTTKRYITYDSKEDYYNDMDILDALEVL